MGTRSTSSQFWVFCLLAPPALLSSHHCILPDVHDQPSGMFSVVHGLHVHHGGLNSRLILGEEKRVGERQSLECGAVISPWPSRRACSHAVLLAYTTTRNTPGGREHGWMLLHPGPSHPFLRLPNTQETHSPNQYLGGLLSLTMFSRQGRKQEPTEDKWLAQSHTASSSNTTHSQEKLSCCKAKSRHSKAVAPIWVPFLQEGTSPHSTFPTTSIKRWLNNFTSIPNLPLPDTRSH